MTYWCANFDAEPVLERGLAEDYFAMQYQYSHDGYEFQGHASQIGATTSNWKALQQVAIGDWLVAYLPPSTFYAVGEVVERKVRPYNSHSQHHFDTVDRTVREHSHLFLDGVVTYTDAVAFYENFSDFFRCPPNVPGRQLGGGASPQPDSWQYGQRIDVRKWQQKVLDGVRIAGLAGAAPFPKLRRAMFDIPEHFFDKILSELRRQADKDHPEV